MSNQPVSLRIDTIKANKEYEINSIKKNNEVLIENEEKSSEKDVKIKNRVNQIVEVNTVPITKMEIKKNSKNNDINITQKYNQNDKFKILFLLISSTYFIIKDISFVICILTTYGMLEVFMEYIEPLIELNFNYIEKYIPKYMFCLTFVSSYFRFDILFIYSLLLSGFMMTNINEIFKKNKY
jgi:hypothetical protein